ncbi:UNVERIFIED_ORG: hypothetical protein FHR35_009077 [Microbispora rosea subsp. rosea]
MLTFVLFFTAFACLAFLISIFARMVITRRRIVAEIHAHMSEHRWTCCRNDIRTRARLREMQ